MKRLILNTSLMLLVTAMLAGSAYAQFQGDEVEGERLAQTGMKFLSVSVDARAAAMGGTLTSLRGNSASMFYNPAGMAYMNHAIHASLGQTQYIGNAEYNVGSAAFRPAGGVYGVIGLSVLSVNYGEFLETIRTDNEQGFEDLGTFSPSALSLGVGYARALTDRFSVGGNVKYVRQDLGASTMSIGEGGVQERQDNAVSTVAVDFGVLYQTGFRSLNFAVAARNFSRELAYAEESFELPLTFRIGISMDVMDFTSIDRDTHSFLLSASAERPRDFAEQLSVGGEYLFMNILALRAGYSFPTDEQGVSLGVGLQQEFGTIGFGFDYAYTPFGVFGNVQRLGLQISL